MSAHVLTRRKLFALAPAATVAAGAFPSLLLGSSAEAQPMQAGRAQSTLPGLGNDAQQLLTSLENGFSFQNFMMDAYATGATLRLAQSYSDEALGATAFTYDNAVSIHAYLASAQPALIARAEILGDGLLYAQANNFPFNDGRFAQGYYVNKPSASGAYITPAAAPFYFYTSAVGDQAWAGMALAQLYSATGANRFLTGALLVANWIVNNTYSTLGAGGFSFGTNINQYNQSVPSTNGKATEHNIDCYAFFTMLNTLTHGGSSASGMSWSALAQHALTFVEAMFNAAGPYFYTGTLGDQVTINPAPIPEDVQTWSFLALLNAKYQGTINWALANLEATDSAAAPHSSLKGTETVHGLVFDTASLTTTAFDPQAVWLEGTAHTIAALAARVLRGSENLFAAFNDVQTAYSLVQQCIKVQTDLSGGKFAGGKAIPSGQGLLAATSVMDTGFGYTYGPSLHIGATGWYLLGATGSNPFQLGYHVIG